MVNTLLDLLQVLVVLVPILLAVAFITVIERKVMGSIQRRVGPNKVGYYGVLQPFADALKLVVKETVVPAHATKSLFFLAPVITLVFRLLGWAVIPFGAGLRISDFPLGILYTLAISSIGIYGVLFAGWAANSKYAFLGSLRSTAQMISYELVLSASILTVILLAGTFNMTGIIEAQESVWFIVPLLPLFIIFFISALAETNRTPFDLPEAESELVAGFFTEHSGMIFVFFFLGEYTSIVLMSCLTRILFLGGYNMTELFTNETFINLQSIILRLKTCIFMFIFVSWTNVKIKKLLIYLIMFPHTRTRSIERLKHLIYVIILLWTRATFPRLRYDQLMTFMWTGMLPVAIALVVLVPSILVAFDIAPYSPDIHMINDKV
ncbi:NADH dehydrogenase subunit 1 (mitochondrion) [Cutaneotrichosporon sp. HIS471]|nr:NADH dehydrogenase subunit 1 [Cutaneotrichosporon sp. HIS471]